MQDHLESLVLRMYKGKIQYSEAVREFRKVFVLTVLRDKKWNRTRTAETLDMHLNTLRRLIREFQLDVKYLRTTRRPPASERPLPQEKKERAT